MPKELYLVMCINGQLKAELRRLAHEERHTLSAFVIKELDRLLPATVESKTSLIVAAPRTYLLHGADHRETKN